MQLFKTLSQEDASRIKKEEWQEYKTASFMRILITIMLIAMVLASWLVSGEVPDPLISLIVLVPFYWVWFQLLPLIEQRGKKEKERSELKFITTFQKFFDAGALQNSIQNLDQRVRRLEETLNKVS